MICGVLLQALGVNSSKDRDTLRKKLKDLKSAMEKEKKQYERLQKEREKMSKQSGSGASAAAKRKKFPFGKS